MDQDNEESALKSKELEEQSTSELRSKENEEDNKDSLPLKKLQEVEEQLSQIVSTGVEDTSFMRNPDTCQQIWEHITKLHPDPREDDYKVDVRLKYIVRALGEGSVLPLTELLSSLKMCIQNLHHFEFDLEEKLAKFVPIFLNRKNLGDAYMNVSGVPRSECRRRECMWVWESPAVDFFPPHLMDQVKESREYRNVLSRRYRALSKLKNCIVTEDLAGQHAALEVLNNMERKKLQEKERKEKLDLKRKVLDVKKKNEKLKLQKTNSNMLLSWLKPQKTEKSEPVVETAKETSSPKEVMEVTQWKLLIECTENQRMELESILSNFNPKHDLNSRPGHPNNQSNPLTQAGCHKNLDSANLNANVNNSDANAKDNVNSNNDNPNSNVNNENANLNANGNVGGNSDKLGTWGNNREKARLETDKIALVIQDYKDFQSPEVDLFELSNSHRDVWTRFHSYLSMHRQFYVDANDNVMLVNEPLSNVEQSNHNASSLAENRHCRVFTMFDNGWKRPPMRYVVGRTSPLVTSFNQVQVEPNIDYLVDSDEDWFERYDADDVEVSEEEEEEDDDEDQEWIVQDTPAVREFSTGIFTEPNQELKNDLVSWVKVFCLYKNWHWIIDGKPLDYEISSKELALKNGINIVGSEFGFGFEGYTKNPIADVLSKLRGDKVRLSRKDVEALLKLCHGKHTRKEDLIAAFKEERPHASTSEIRNKFSKYLTREKIDDRPHRWMVSDEAARLFNIRKELDRILTDQLNMEILSEPIF